MTKLTSKAQLTREKERAAVISNSCTKK